MSVSKTYAKLKVVIVDDHALFADCFKLVLNQMENIEVVGTYLTVEKYLKNLDKIDFDIVFMDIDFRNGKLDGFDATKETLSKKPQVKVIAVSMHDDGITVDRMLKTGAIGFIPKDVSADKLKPAIAKVAAGELYVSPTAAKNFMLNSLNTKVTLNTADRKSQSPMKSDFSELELSIMLYSSKGMGDKEIAARLHLKKKQIDYEKNKLYKKLGVKNVAEMVALSIRFNLISLK